MMGYTYNPNTEEAGGAQVQGQSEMHSETLSQIIIIIINILKSPLLND
jgi:hypothetical protein